MFENREKNSPATVGDLEELANMVVNNFTTKEDAVNFATKDDLKQELSRFATKEDLTNLDIKMDKRMSVVETRLEAKMEEQTEKILSSNDQLVKKLDTFLTEKIVLGGQLKEQGEEVDKLKGRVMVVEKRIGIEPTPVPAH